MSTERNRDASLGEQDEDALLRRRFAQLREADAHSAPPFARVANRATPRVSWTRWLVPSLALGAAAAVGAFLWRTPRPADRPATPTFALVAGELRVPTDYFLEVSPSLRADEVPDIGAVDWYPLTAPTTTPSTSPLASPSSPAAGDTSRSH